MMVEVDEAGTSGVKGLDKVEGGNKVPVEAETIE